VTDPPEKDLAPDGGPDHGFYPGNILKSMGIPGSRPIPFAFPVLSEIIFSLNDGYILFRVR
jgi:hypothetical protein